MVVVVIAGLLASIAVPVYTEYVDRSRVTRAIGDIGQLHVAINRFRLGNADRFPSNLNELGIAIPDDPWGRPYVFLNILDDKPKIGEVRKDGKLNPINTDYDLYSMGADGESVKPLNAKKSRDDIVRANDGQFIDLAEKY